MTAPATLKNVPDDIARDLDELYPMVARGGSITMHVSDDGAVKFQVSIFKKVERRKK